MRATRCWPLALALLASCGGSAGSDAEGGPDGIAEGSVPNATVEGSAPDTGSDAGRGTDSTVSGDTGKGDGAAVPSDGSFDASTEGSNARPDAGPDGAGVSDGGTGLDAMDDALSDGATDSADDAASDSAIEATIDSSVSDASEAGVEGGTSAGADASVDAATDTSTDAMASATALVLAGSPTGMLAGELDVGGTWKTTTLSGATSFAPALTMTRLGAGVGVFCSGTGGVLTATLWMSGVGWQIPSAVSSGAVARAQPSIDATGGTTAHTTYQDGSYKFWYAAYSAGSWSAPQAISSSGNQSYGPVSAAIAARGTDATVAFIDGQSPSVNYAAQQDLVGGTWQARADLVGPESLTIEPSLIALDVGPELMMMFAQQSGQILFATRTGGVWSAPAAITNALTGNPVGLAPLPNGGAILAFRGTDTNLYWSVYASGSWSTVAPFQAANLSITGSPALTHGVSGDVAEIAFVDDSGHANASSLSGGVWRAPTLLGGTNMVGVSIASSP